MPRSAVTPAPAASFDPVIGRVNGIVSDAVLMRDAKVMWELTHDRRYLQQLRRLRRLR